MGSKTNGNKVAAANRRKGDVGEAAQWAEYYSSLTFAVTDTIPPEWKPAVEIAKFIGIKPASCRNALRKLELAGKIKYRKFRVWGGNNVKNVKHYKLPDV